MTDAEPLQLFPEEKLYALRRLDEFRFWRSLDDERFCQGCGNLITGHAIEVVASGKHTFLRCPTSDCPSQPSDWIYPDPIAAARAMAPSRAPAGDSPLLPSA